jgi:hypothetical protein
MRKTAIFPGGSRTQFGTADENNYPTVTAEGMAGYDLAARRPYRIRVRDGFPAGPW